MSRDHSTYRAARRNYWRSLARIKSKLPDWPTVNRAIRIAAHKLGARSR